MTIYERAKIKVETRQLNAELYAGQRKHVFLGQSNGNVFLIYQERDGRNLVRKTVQVRCATLNPMRGWAWTLTRAEYEARVRKTGHKINKPEPVAPRLMCAELRQEWAACGGI